VTPDILATWGPEEREDAIFGSKILIVLEETQLVTLWLVKGGLLIFYARLS